MALRNSHDKKFAIGVGFGGRVFCCDNLSFIADHAIKRKHTANAKRDLPGLVGELIEPLAIQRERQHQTFLTYQGTPLSDLQADHCIMIDVPPRRHHTCSALLTLRNSGRNPRSRNVAIAPRGGSSTLRPAPSMGAWERLNEGVTRHGVADASFLRFEQAG